MERFGLVKVHPIGSAHLVRVLVLLSLPSCAVPFLAVGAVATGACIRTIRYLELGTHVKLNQGITVAPNWVVVLLWRNVRVTHSCPVVARGVEVDRSFGHRTHSITAAP